MTAEGLLLVAVVDMAAGHVEAGQAYEDAVLTLLSRHGGTLDRRMRDTSASSQTSGSSEVHLIRFENRAGYESFLADPDRLALRETLGAAAPTTRVLEVRDLP